MSGYLISCIQIELGFALFLVTFHVFFLSCSYSTNIVYLLCAMKEEVNKALDQQEKAHKLFTIQFWLSAIINICPDCGAGLLYKDKEIHSV